LPEEVILHIFGYLAPDGGKPIYVVAELCDLAFLTFVSQKCRPIVEPLMYQTVTITAGRSTETLTVPVILVGRRWSHSTFP
jgi:hypothetical protein